MWMNCLTMLFYNHILRYCSHWRWFRFTIYIFSSSQFCLRMPKDQFILRIILQISFRFYCKRFTENNHDIDTVPISLGDIFCAGENELAFTLLGLKYQKVPLNIFVLLSVHANTHHMIRNKRCNYFFKKSFFIPIILFPLFKCFYSR